LVTRTKDTKVFNKKADRKYQKNNNNNIFIVIIIINIAINRNYII